MNYYKNDSEKHNVFISYYHKGNQKYRDEFETLFGHLFINKSVEEGDIDSDKQFKIVTDKAADINCEDDIETESILRELQTEIAKEAADNGFDEVQFDYVRFPAASKNQ